MTPMFRRPTLRPTVLAAAVLSAFAPLGLAGAQTAGAAGAMPTVTVRDRANDDYVAPAVSVVTGTDTPLERIPQSVTVITRRLIDDQGAVTLSDALRNVTAVRTVDPRDQNNTNFRIRGFSALTVIDGLPASGTWAMNESLVDVERIDVVKGPAGAVQSVSGAAAGSGPGFLGGTVAVTTKAPIAAPLREVGLRLGTYGERAGTLDINQPISDQLAFRLVGEVSASDSETDRVNFKRIALMPSLAWRPDASRELVVRMRYRQGSTLDYSGLPPSGTVLPAAYAIPRNRNITADGTPDTTNDSLGVNVQWRQRIDDTWSWSLVGGYADAKVDQQGVFPFPFGSAGQVVAVAGARLWQQYKTLSLVPSVQARFDTGGVRHQLNMGYAYDRTRDDAYLNFAPGFGLIGFFDVVNPAYPVWQAPAVSSPPDQRNRYRTDALFIQDQFTVAERLHLLAALRHTRVAVDDTNTASFIDNHTTNTKTTPRVGAVLDLTSQVSLFAGHGRGFQVPTNAVYTTPPKPEESDQTEVGIRVKGLGGVTGSLAWFDLTRKNAPVADPVNFGQTLQAGKQRSRGFDLDLRWQATPSWWWLAGVTVQDPKIVEDSTLPVGSQLFNVPKQAVRLATRYDWRTGDLRGLGIGAGVTRASKLPGDSSNTFFTPDYTVWDAQASYTMKNLRLGLAINNLTNKQYWTPSAYFGGGQVLPALPRTVMLSANLAF